MTLIHPPYRKLSILKHSVKVRSTLGSSFAYLQFLVKFDTSGSVSFICADIHLKHWLKHLDQSTTQEAREAMISSGLYRPYSGIDSHVSAKRINEEFECGKNEQAHRPQY